MQIEGRPVKVEYVGFGQELDIQGKKNDVLVCGGWASAHSVPNATEPERSFAIMVRLQNTSGQWSNHALRPVQLGMGRLAVREPRPRRPCRFCQDRLRGRLHRQLQLRQVLEPVPLSRVLRRQLWLQWQPTGAMSPPPPIWRAWKRTWSTIVRTNLYRWVQPGRENTTENRYTNWYGDTDAQRAKHLLLRSRTPGVCH